MYLYNLVVLLFALRNFKIIQPFQKQWILNNTKNWNCHVYKFKYHKLLKNFTYFDLWKLFYANRFIEENKVIEKFYTLLYYLVCTIMLMMYNNTYNNKKFYEIQSCFSILWHIESTVPICCTLFCAIIFGTNELYCFKTYT